MVKLQENKNLKLVYFQIKNMKTKIQYFQDMPIWKTRKYSQLFKGKLIR